MTTAADRIAALEGELATTRAELALSKAKPPVIHHGWIIAPLAHKAELEKLGITLGPHDGEAFTACEVAAENLDNLDGNWGRWRWSFGADKKQAKSPPKKAELVTQEDERAESGRLATEEAERATAAAIEKVRAAEEQAAKAQRETAEKSSP